VTFGKIVTIELQTFHHKEIIENQKKKRKTVLLAEICP
jgi:hypothetical protein